MSISKRQEQILELLQENISLTVEKLSQLTYTSPSSIRRDLAKLQNLHLLKRTHGGASLPESSSRIIPLENRMEINISEKKKIAKKASSLICDGQYIMLDSSSSANFLIPYIAEHKNITLFTNSLLTAIDAVNHGIKVHCLGGYNANNSFTLSGPECYRSISKIHTDIFFFSLNSLDKYGTISSPSEDGIYIRKLMMKNSDKSVFLCDSQKFGRCSTYTFSSIDDVDVAVFDSPYKELQTKCEIIV